MSDFERDLGPIQEQSDDQLLKLIPESLPDEIKQALKSCADNLSKQESESEKFEEYIYNVNSDDIVTQYSGLNRCRKLLSNAQIAVPTEQMIEMFLQKRVHVKIFDIAKNTNIPLVKYEALWIICNIVFGTQKQIQTILDNDGINILFSALESEHDEIIELGVWGLANIAGDNLKFRDMLLQNGVLQPFIHLAQIYKGRQNGNKNPNILKKLVWAFSNLVRGKSAPKKIVIMILKNQFCIDLLSILCQILVGTEDEEMLIDACWSLSYLSQDENLIHILIKERVTQKLILLMQTENQKLVIPALRTVGNILTGNEEQTDAVLKLGAIQIFEKLLHNKTKAIQKEVCWSLSNIAAGNSNQVKQIIRNDQLFNSVYLSFDNGTPEIIEQISFLLSNCVVNAELQDIDYLLMQHQYLQKMSSLLDMNQKVVINVTLEGIFELLNRVQYDDGRLEQYKKLIADSLIMKKVDKYLKHPAKEISKKARQVFEIFQSKNNS
ncbi:unnamed protein product (macronuclear) [Paramecium tetraurelia]|uniref:Importin subunit alpha n=1 Tax=Paramecium tetraurelia TaxID=5888 RepID=A0DSS5_PARTE|nr:uncharacterized protein GSPATT00019785001 [Paramecium tetraurelia]CAK86092.1 unnamed protein product [Paramecium tetraurelia]|eukprot:XP_001453489.1 hypothetical protein (macronuclear) [Paramecium tetraurelia strain d4-2]